MLNLKKASPRLTDELLSAAFSAFSQLQTLSLAGCTKVTEGGVIDVLRANPDIEELRLQGLSPSFVCVFATCYVSAFKQLIEYKSV